MLYRNWIVDPAVVEDTVQITPLTGSHELDQIRREWQDLESKRHPRNPFLSWKFMSLWWRHYGQSPGHRLHVLAGFEQGRLVGIAPCYLQSPGRQRATPECLRFLGDNIIAPDFLDFITAPERTESFLMAAARHIKSQCRHTRIELNGIVLESVRGPSWQSFLHESGLDVAFFEPAPWIKLPADFPTYIQSLSPGWRRSLERKRRRLAKNCPYRFEVYSGWNAVENFERFVALNRQRLRDRKRDGGFVDQDFTAFHQELATALAPLDMIELHFLRADSGRDIAGNYFLKDPGSEYYYYYQQGFAAEFGVYSPANVLTASSIESAISRSAVEFHFLRGAEPYKSRWTRESRILLSLLGFNK